MVLTAEQCHMAVLWAEKDFLLVKTVLTKIATSVSERLPFLCPRLHIWALTRDPAFVREGYLTLGSFGTRTTPEDPQTRDLASSPCPLSPPAL